MWNRKELKAKGKAAFRANYWNCVIVALILTAIIGGGAAAGKNRADSAAANEEDKTVLEMVQKAPEELLIVLGSVALGVGMISFAVKLLAFNPLQVGCKRFFLINSDEPAQLGEMAYAFKNNYGNTVGAMFLRDLFTVLWSLLFIIPGVIKSYSYCMVPYILAEEPDIGAREAIDRSRRMMNGHKWNAFVLDLSFFGWLMLAALTADIAGVLWTQPYMEATTAELYKAIKNA